MSRVIPSLIALAAASLSRSACPSARLGRRRTSARAIPTTGSCERRHARTSISASATGTRSVRRDDGVFGDDYTLERPEPHPRRPLPHRGRRDLELRLGAWRAMRAASTAPTPIQTGTDADHPRRQHRLCPGRLRLDAARRRQFPDRRPRRLPVLERLARRRPRQLPGPHGGDSEVNRLRHQLAAPRRHQRSSTSATCSTSRPSWPRYRSAGPTAPSARSVQPDIIDRP